MEKYIDLEKIAAEYDPNKTSPAEQRLADVVVAAIRELAPNAVVQSGKKDHEYGVYTQEELETPLTFEAKADDTKIYFLTYDSKVTRTIEVSTDGGQTWNEFESEKYDKDNNTPIATLNIGQKALVRGDNPNGLGMGDGDSYSAGSFRIDGEAYVYGNIMSLLSKEDFASMKEVPEYAFTSLFLDYDNFEWDNTESLFSRPSKKLLFPATTLANRCYDSVFNNCRSLTIAPELPATMLGDCCYNNMFYNCASLITAPELPATTLAERCYSGMFSGCTSLTDAPKLPAIKLENNCYSSMFYGCTSLTIAPELPATTLAVKCYSGMFSGCTSLTDAPELPVTTLADWCYSAMFNNCKNLTTTPKLPATTLTKHCYDSMFAGCTLLTSAPELPATTLVEACYFNMFANCHCLSFVKCAFTTTPGISYTAHWLLNVFPVGVIMKKGTWTTTGNDGIPGGWTARQY